MKRNRVLRSTIMLCIGCAAALTIAGCATQNSGTTTSETDEHSAVEEATVTTRTVSFPAAYFEGQTEDEVRSSLEGEGVTDITANEDGSYSVTMSIDKYNELVDTLNANVKESLDGIPNSEDYPSITAIEYDETFSNVTLTSSAAELGLSEAFVGWAVGLSANMYQQIAGQPVNCTVTVLGPEGEVIQSGVYPEDFENAGTAEAH